MTSLAKILYYKAWNVGIPGHNVVPTEGNKQKLCRYCRAHEQKSPSGWKILTRSKCETCNVPLCRDGKTERNCFRLYHEKYVFNTKADDEQNKACARNFATVKTKTKLYM